MKKNFSEVFDCLDAAELDEVLDGVRIEGLDEVTARGIRDAALEGAGLADQKMKQPKRRRWLFGTLAACLALLLGLGTYAYAMENKEYNAAVRFFNENHLSIEGLTRGEIKAVYRDITTESFTYAKTAEVILNTARVEGYAIPQEIPDAPLTREETIDLWGAYYLGVSQKDVHYSIFYVETEEDGVHVDERSIISKRDGQTLLWQYTITGYIVNSYRAVSDGVIVWGQTDITDSWQNQSAWMTKLDNDGNEVWTRCLDNGFLNEYICTVVEESDGGCTVISRGDYKTTCLSRYTADGKRILLKELDVGDYGVGCVARLGDGYLVQLCSYMDNEYARIVKLDHDGNLTESYSYGSDDAWYYITDMAEFGGKVYLSAYAVPKLDGDESSAGGRYEIAGVLNELFARFESGGNPSEIPNEELTSMVREHYTAVLLVCEPTGGEPRTFYQAEGSLGGKLTVNERGELVWDVESIASTFYSPATSSFTIGGTCQVYRYTFNGTGALVSQVKTDETTAYRR